MSETGRRDRMVLDWRGPLLAAGIFGAAFAILLLMAHQNQSKASDMGSSLREDPYGTRLLFDSYQRAGYQVIRSQDEDSLSSQEASRTTAFLVGGRPSDWRMDKGKIRIGDQFRRRLEDFLARGGRVVLVDPVGHLKSESQGWEVENKWNEKPHEARPAWISADQPAMPAGSEDMYLTADAPWLQTDANWTTLYPGPANVDLGTDLSKRVAYMAIRKVGNGELIVASQESFLLNEAIKTHPSPVLLDFLVGGRSVIWVDETLHGLHQDQGVLWLLQRYRLQSALFLFWATLLVLLWSMSGDLVRRPARDENMNIVRSGEGAGVAASRLLQRSIPSKKVGAECWEQFRRRSPQDAEAISAGLESGPRLKAALALPPVAAFKRLSQLIAERRESAKSHRQATVTSSPMRSSEENPII
jgi:hypothetical protein